MRSLVLSLALLAAGPAHASVLDDLQGKWTTGLMSDSEGYVQYRQTYDFQGTAMSMKIDILVNHPMGQSGERMQWDGVTRVIGPSTAVPGAWEVDIEITKYLVTPLHPSSVENYNNEKQCGFDDWRLGVAKDVTGLACEDIESTVGTIHDLIKVTPNESIQFGYSREEDPMNGPRPTSLDPDNVVPRNGTGGPIDPRPTEDLIKGFYQVTSYKANPTGCADAGLRPATSTYTHFQMIANRDIIPMMVGWSFETCNGVEACQAKADEIAFYTDFEMHEKLDDGTYKGLGRSSNWTGKCNVQAIETKSVRAADGSLVMRSRFLSGVVEGIDTMEDCKLDNPLVDAQLPLFQCTKMLELGAKKL